MPPIRIQDPDDAEAPRLLEAIADGCVGAERGGGIYAYARRTGIDVLFDDPAFGRFLDGGRFHLVVGVDGVTDNAALDALQERARERPTLTVQAFFHGRVRTTFHPKVCWFGNRVRGTAIVGSGNLTVGGLMRNWEAFGLQPLDREEAADTANNWDAWVRRHVHHLRQLDDADVRNRAALNVVNRVDRNIEIDDGGLQPDPAPEGTRVLIAEIPRAADRWAQANFKKADFENFFEAANPNRRVSLWPVDDQGVIAAVPEIRPGVAVASKNYRLELAAAAGRLYPDGGRPIGVFVRTRPREFVYMLVMPGSPHYVRAAALLGPVIRGNQLRHPTIALQDLRRDWPACPMLPHVTAVGVNR